MQLRVPLSGTLPQNPASCQSFPHGALEAARLSHERVRSEVTRAKNVIAAAPSAGPKKVLAPPMKVCRTTLADACAEKIV